LERLAELLFILASVDRLTLLSEIKNMKLRSSHLTIKLSATPQETSKHLMRLRDAKLIEKDSDGFLSLTPFGKIVVNLIPSFRFLAQNREYFSSHDISSLPLEFIERLGEMQKGEHTNNVGSVFAHLQQVVQSAEDYIWLMADHRLGNQEYVTKSGKLETDTMMTWRIILPTGSNINWKEVRRAAGIHKGRIEYRLIESSDDIKIGIAMNEKIAGVVFQDTMGKIDFNGGFRSDNPLFHKWCKDLFVYYWNKVGRSVQI
jgi:predicted transcriptional regulator